MGENSKTVDNTNKEEYNETRLTADEIFQQFEEQVVQQRRELLVNTAVSEMEKTNMADAVGLANYNQFLDKFEALDDDTLRLYSKLGSKIEYRKLRGTLNFHQSGTVQLTQEAFDGIKASNALLYDQLPLDIAFHENGHALDFLGLRTLVGDKKVIIGEREIRKMGRKGVVSVHARHASALPEYQLKETIRKDLWTFVNGDLPMFDDPARKYKRGEKKQIKQISEANFDKFKEKMLLLQKENPGAINNLSDMVEATGWLGEYPFEYGHGKKYWKTAGNAEAEFFAEMSALVATDKEGYNIVKQILPNAVETYHKIVKDIIAGGL